MNEAEIRALCEKAYHAWEDWLEEDGWDNPHWGVLMDAMNDMQAKLGIEPKHGYGEAV